MEISEFLKGEEAFPDASYGDGYRCSVYLKDGLFLPCVIIRRNEKYIELACKRFEEEKKEKVFLVETLMVTEKLSKALLQVEIE